MNTCRPARSLTVFADCRNLRLRHARDRNVAQTLVKPGHYARWNGGGIRIFVACGAAGASQVTSLLILDQYALFYIGLIIAATFAIAILCYGYLQRHSETREELYVLLLVATLGSMVLVASSHFVSFFLGLEILSVALYALSAYLHTRSRSAGGRNQVLDSGGIVFGFPAVRDGPHLCTTRHDGPVPSGQRCCLARRIAHWYWEV